MHQCLFHTSCKTPVRVPVLSRWFAFVEEVDAPAGDEVPEGTFPHRRSELVSTQTGNPKMRTTAGFVFVVHLPLTSIAADEADFNTSILAVFVAAPHYP